MPFTSLTRQQTGEYYSPLLSLARVCDLPNRSVTNAISGPPAKAQPGVEPAHESASQTHIAPPGVTINISSAEVRMQGQQPQLNGPSTVQQVQPRFVHTPVHELNPPILTTFRGSCVLPVERHEHLIRGLKDKTVWFSSRGEELLTVPTAVPSPQLRLGDLFVHVSTGNRKQVWLWDAERWIPTELHHPHPYLRGYVLNILANGEPSWVTKDTIRTYMSRVKKRERERSGKSAAAE